MSSPNTLLYTIDKVVQSQIDSIHSIGLNDKDPLVLGKLIRILQLIPNPSITPVRFEFNNHTFDALSIEPECIMYVATLGIRDHWDKYEVKTVQQLLDSCLSVHSKTRVSSTSTTKCRFVDTDVVYYADNKESYLIGVEMGTNRVAYLVTGTEEQVVTVKRNTYEQWRE
jgi:hypothetical protein